MAGPGSLERLALLASASILVNACVSPASPPTAPPSAARTTLAAATSGATNLELVWRVDHGLGQPTGIALRPDGSVLVVDFDTGAIHSISADGSAVSVWGETTTGPGKVDVPAGIAVGKYGFVFVADHGHSRVVRYTPDGKFDLAWGKLGSSVGAFDGPDVLAVDPEGFLYVAEDRNARVQVFDQSGASARVIRSPGTERFMDPTGIAFGTDVTFIADYGDSQVWVLDGKDQLVRTIGAHGGADGQLSGLSMIATNAVGTLFVTDYDNGRIQAFKPTGEWLATYVLEDGRRMSKPWGLAIGSDGDLYVAEFGARRVSRFRAPSS